MITIDIPEYESFNPETNEFLYAEAVHLELEHSLAAIAEWEGTWHIPFLNRESISIEELRDYVRCMTLNGPIPSGVYLRLRQADYDKVQAYLADPKSAKVFYDKPQRKKRNQPSQTAEDFYHAMAYYGIPFECEHWNFNRLSALLRVCEKSGGNEPKMTYREQQAFWNQINADRRAKLNSKG